MKKFVKIVLFEAGVISDPCGNYLPPEVVAEMRHRWPQFFPAQLKGFHFHAELGDPVIDEVTGFLRQTGREPCWTRYPGVPNDHPTLYQIEGERVWEAAELDEASYFRWVIGTFAGTGRQVPPDGTFEVEFSSYKGKKIGRLEMGWNPFCSVEYRQELEAQNFQGLTFRPVQIKSRKPHKLELWEVWSSVTLPPVLNEVTGVEGEPFDPATSKTCDINDLYRPCEYRFSWTGVAALEPFDIALTTERWGYGPPDAREPALIVSRRFRDWFMTQKVPCEWWPVVLE